MRGEEGDVEKGASCLFLSQFVNELEFTETEQPEGETWNYEVEAAHPLSTHSSTSTINQTMSRPPSTSLHYQTPLNRQ